MIINFSNIEELIFQNEFAQKTLPVQYFSLFEQWRIGKRIPALKQLGKHAILDLLNQLDDEDIIALESLFDEKIIVERLNYNIAKNIVVPLKDACDALCQIEGFGYFNTWRDENNLYISFWR